MLLPTRIRQLFFCLSASVFGYQPVFLVISQCFWASANILLLSASVFGHPPVFSRHPPVFSRHPPVFRRHPHK
jgi:hypothetical protein